MDTSNLRVIPANQLAEGDKFAYALPSGKTALAEVELVQQGRVLIVVFSTAGVFYYTSSEAVSVVKGKA